MIEDSYATSGEAAKVLGIHRFAVQQLFHRNALPAEKVANRWLVPRTALMEFAKTYEGKRGRPRQKRKYTKRSPRWFNC